MAQRWPAVSYDRWGETCDTLHAQTQVLGKLAVELAPPEPELQHGALRLSARLGDCAAARARRVRVAGGGAGSTGSRGGGRA